MNKGMARVRKGENGRNVRRDGVSVMRRKCIGVLGFNEGGGGEGELLHYGLASDETFQGSFNNHVRGAQPGPYNP